MRRTTRDEPDYDKLMHYRMRILEREGLTLADIQAVIDTMAPLPGAVEFLAWVRSTMQTVIITDSFYEFVVPFLPKIGYPTVFAHTLQTDDRGMLAGYRLRVPDGKRLAAESFRALGFRTVAVGDSYNDTRMLGAADQGILFRPPDNVIREFPHFPVTRLCRTPGGDRVIPEHAGTGLRTAGLTETGTVPCYIGEGLFVRTIQ